MRIGIETCRNIARASAVIIILSVAAPSQGAESSRELRQRAEGLERQAQELKEDGQPDRAREVMRQVEELRAQAGKPPREQAVAGAESPRHRLARFDRSATTGARPLRRPQPRAEMPDPFAEGPERQRRLEHLQIAAEHLRAAGMDLLAERLQQQARSARQRPPARFDRRPAEGEPPPLQAEVQELRRELRKLRARVDELNRDRKQ